ncbi:MAG: metallophosphoesterase [Phycisphaerales bacterium]|nr:metallophosphoesterase [Phycisphaerales bacterium]
MKTAVIGDVHGCGRELEELLGFLEEDQGVRRVVLVGDLLTKGLSPERVIHSLDEFERAGGEVVVVCGNHDLRLFAAMVRVEGGLHPTLLPKPERRTCERLRSHDHSAGAIRWLGRATSTVQWADGNGLTVVHAGIRPELGLARTSDHDKIHLKATDEQRHWWLDYDGSDGLILFGHKPVKEPVRQERDGKLVAMNLDTGCVYGGKLTAYLPATGQFVAVESQQDAATSTANAAAVA